jgi:tetratricopeptide (TPR) repeat protein
MFELADYHGSTDVLKSLRANPSFDSKCANLLAVSDSKLGLYQDAYVVLAQEIHDHPEDLPAYLNLVTACAEGGNFNKAAEVAAEAYRRFPNSQEVLVVEGAADTLLGHLDQAQKEFSAAVHIDPKAAEPRFFLALTEYKLTRFAAAATILQSAIDDGIADADLHYLMAECLLKLEPVDMRKVLAQLDRSIELNSHSVSARTLRGRLLLEAGQIKQATIDLQLAVQLDQTSRSAAYNLARAYRAQGKTEEAQSLFSRLRSETGDTLTELGDKRLNQALKSNSTGNP